MKLGLYELFQIRFAFYFLFLQGIKATLNLSLSRFYPSFDGSIAPLLFVLHILNIFLNAINSLQNLGVSVLFAFLGLKHFIFLLVELGHFRSLHNWFVSLWNLLEAIQFFEEDCSFFFEFEDLTLFLAWLVKVKTDIAHLLFENIVYLIKRVSNE